jgi:glucokinase
MKSNYTRQKGVGMHYIGIDIGGTGIKAALTDDSGVVLESTKAATPAADLELLIRAVSGLVAELQSKGPVGGVGVGVAGLLSARTRILETSPNIPCLQQVNLEEKLRKALSMYVITENDAKAGAYGEWTAGAGKRMRNMAYITIGTGLGCGLVLDEHMFRGTSGYAGELGHVVIQPEGRRCACGSHGCLETLVSATGIVQTARDAGISGVTTAGALYESAMQGDSEARAVFQETGRFLGIACSNLINLLNLEGIVVGGGVMASGELLLGAARNEARRRAFPPSLRDCAIVQSQLWPDSGTIGAAMLARDTA